MAAKKKTDWSIKGELALNCSCEVFCPCVVSLGKHPPTEGYCHAWMAARIDEGHHEGVDLSGLNVALLLDIPGKMGDGDWKAAAYIDKRSDDAQYDALISIFSGQSGGTSGVLKLLVSTFLGARREEVTYEVKDKKRIIGVPKVLTGAIEPIPGGDPGDDVKIVNSQYWMGADVTLARGLKSRIRDFGRVWDFEGKSAEILDIHWHS